MSRPEPIGDHAAAVASQQLAALLERTDFAGLIPVLAKIIAGVVAEGDENFVDRQAVRSPSRSDGSECRKGIFFEGRAELMILSAALPRIIPAEIDASTLRLQVFERSKK